MSFLSQPIPLVLASSSPIRAQMLKRVGLQFSVAPSTVDETAIKQRLGHADPLQLAAELARAKCLSVAEHYPNHITLGADQVCALGQQIFSKPGSYEAAHAQLQQLRGTTHQQHSAVCIAKGSEVLHEAVESASLTLRALSDEEIHAYVREDEPLQACGSYKFESFGRHLFAATQGASDVIQGMPLQPVLLTLYRVGALRMG